MHVNAFYVHQTASGLLPRLIANPHFLLEALFNMFPNTDRVNVTMSQMDEGPRSIGSFVKVISKVFGGNMSSDEEISIHFFVGVCFQAVSFY